MARFRARPRDGFTLIELLVVVAIIAVLMALLLPAVQKVREAANRIKCGGNMSEIGKAIHMFHHDNKKFPAGGITEGNCCSTQSKGNWAIYILPYIEQKALYQRYDDTQFNESAANAFVRTQSVPLYLCPSDHETTPPIQPESGPGSGLQYAIGSYRAVSGRSDGSAWFDNADGTTLPRNWRGLIHSVWLAQGLKEERMADMISGDGASNTIIVGEYTTRTTPRRRTFWAYTYTSYNQSSVVPEARTFMPDYSQCVSIGGAGGSNPCKRAWGSFHNGGANFLFGDNSVRFVRQSIDMFLLANMATIAGRDIVDLSGL